MHMLFVIFYVFAHRNWLSQASISNIKFIRSHVSGTYYAALTNVSSCVCNASAIVYMDLSELAMIIVGTLEMTTIWYKQILKMKHHITSLTFESSCPATRIRLPIIFWPLSRWCLFHRSALCLQFYLYNCTRICSSNLHQLEPGGDYMQRPAASSLLDLAICSR